MQGHIHKRVRLTKDGRQRTLWYVVVDVGRDAAGKRKQKWHGGFKTRREAEAARAKIINDMNIFTHLLPTGVVSSHFVRKDWLPMMRSQVKPSTWDSYRRNLELYVLPRLGHLELHKVSQKHLNSLYAELLASGRRNGRGGLSVKTVRYLHTTIHKVFEDACDAQLVAQNPAARARPPRLQAASRQEMRFWTAEQLGQFLAHARGHRLHAAFHLAAMTGMRRGEVLGLRWKDVDLGRRRLSIRQTIISVAYDVVVSTPKTHQARVVDLDPGTVEILNRHQLDQINGRSEWAYDREAHDLVFTREDGRPLHPEGFTRLFNRQVAKSGLPRIRFHDLRHTHASIAVQAGIPVKVISERLGHESPAFTLKQYAHAMPGMQKDAAAEIAEIVLNSPVNYAGLRVVNQLPQPVRKSDSQSQKGKTLRYARPRGWKHELKGMQ